MTPKQAASGELLRLAELGRLEKGMSPAPWDTDATKSEGEYGDGPNTHTGFDVATILDVKGKVLFDALNSDAGEIVEDGPDEYGGVYAWDDVSKRNAAGIKALRNSAPALIACVRAAKDLFDGGFVAAGIRGEPSEWKQEFEDRTNAIARALASLEAGDVG